MQRLGTGAARFWAPAAVGCFCLALCVLRAGAQRLPGQKHVGHLSLNPQWFRTTWRLCASLSAITLTGVVTCECCLGASAERGVGTELKGRAESRVEETALRAGAAGALRTLCPWELPEGPPRALPCPGALGTCCGGACWTSLRRPSSVPGRAECSCSWHGCGRDPVQGQVPIEQGPLAPGQGASSLPEDGLITTEARETQPPSDHCGSAPWSPLEPILLLVLCPGP